MTTLRKEHVLEAGGWERPREALDASDQSVVNTCLTCSQYTLSFPMMTSPPQLSVQVYRPHWWIWRQAQSRLASTQSRDTKPGGAPRELLELRDRKCQLSMATVEGPSQRQ